MISFTSAELNAWIAAFFFPLARILALLAAAPPFNNAGLTTRVRLVLGLALVTAIAPALPAMPAIEPVFKITPLPLRLNTGSACLMARNRMVTSFAMLKSQSSRVIDSMVPPRTPEALL